jgi:hypothetical protein
MIFIIFVLFFLVFNNCGNIPPYTQSEIDSALDTINVLRLGVIPKASNMVNITWDSQLAAIALDYLRNSGCPDSDNNGYLF